jgi:hypothetical protein
MQRSRTSIEYGGCDQRGKIVVGSSRKNLMFEDRNWPGVFRLKAPQVNFLAPRRLLFPVALREVEVLNTWGLACGAPCANDDMTSKRT